ncbi:EAL domain-containing protein [Methylobacterium sp. J-059]|uniref:putative bifunctional diguanylate cyclase/phosphodiesterase n=1 Tax=Methylobacterium sp. J-059 TaxID=2836643 RepID=UPI001FB92D3D|nr:EAL domain-containing protein [Methylobacterium sp. J-059]MCJ2039659.1 EAL domain-containing protein [Methylobacterium sp. J-059]
MPVQTLEELARIDSDWVWQTDAAQNFTYLSPEVERFLGRTAGALTGTSRMTIAANGGDGSFWEPYFTALDRRQAFTGFIYPYAHPDGHVRWFRISGEPVVAPDGTFCGYRGTGTDISSEGQARSALADALAELRTSHASLVEQNKRFEAALSNMTQGLCLFDEAARLVVYNQRYCEIFGLAPEALRIGMSQREICTMLVAAGCYRGGTTVDALCEGTRQALLDPDPKPIQRELADGRILAVCYPTIEDGGWVSTFEDITERRRNEARIAHMARHDALTDLPNRTALREHGLSMLGKPRRAGETTRLAILCLDLDRFKAVNDMHGHGAGDALLRAVSERLCARVRTGDLVARLGGDEFAVLHRVADAAGALALAERMIELVSTPYDLDGYTVEIGMSVGIAIADEAADDIDRLLKNADEALYHAKGKGRGTACLFEAAMDETAEVRRAIERDLADALKLGMFEVHYQPLVNLDSNRVTGLEALVRWRHPERGLIPPATFIPVAEETGLIVALGEWVLNRACRDAVAWPSGISVAVNVSAVQLRHRTFAQTVLLALAESGLRSDRLELEITESVLLDDTEANLETLHLLRRTGIRISMDDFGTGYSSLTYLRRFPFDKIKIDRSFVQDAGKATEAGAIIRALVSLGSSLGITTLVEGIETAEQLAAVRAEGCQEMQGFLFSRPRTADEITAMLTAARDEAAAA